MLSTSATSLAFHSSAYNKIMVLGRELCPGTRSDDAEELMALADC